MKKQTLTKKQSLTTNIETDMKKQKMPNIKIPKQQMKKQKNKNKKSKPKMKKRTMNEIIPMNSKN